MGQAPHGLEAAPGAHHWHLLKHFHLNTNQEIQLRREPAAGTATMPPEPDRVSFGCCGLFSFLLFLSSVRERWCQLGQPPFLLLLSCPWASHTPPTSFPCVLSFQLLMDGCCPHTGGIRPTLLPKTLGSGSNQHFSSVSRQKTGA